MFDLDALTPGHYDVRLGWGIGWRTVHAVDLDARTITVNGASADETYPASILLEARKRSYPLTQP